MTTRHVITVRHERHALTAHAGHRACCTCGWASDCYAQRGDTDRAVEVHLRREKAADFDALIARSSIGQGLADIKARGIDAHLADLEREMSAWRYAKKRSR